MANSSTGLARIWRAAGYSLGGLRAAWRHEAAFRQELLGTMVLTPLAFALGRGPVDYALLIGSFLIVLTTELINSAIEAVTDRVGQEHHELSGRAKDFASAAVLVSLVLLALVWVAVAFERFGAALG